MSKTKPSSISTFERDFEQLTNIVDRLESGNIPLAEMLQLYEEGVSLSTSLSSVLSEAELRIEKLAAMHEEGMRAAQPNSSRSAGTDDLATDPNDLLF